jgi:PAS domain S-box-containing protein
MQLSPDLGLAVLESILTGVYVVDRERTIVFWNAGAERISGYLRHQVIGRKCGESILAHCDQANRPLCGDDCPLRDTIRDGAQRTMDINLRHRDGYLVPVTVHAVPVRDAGGRIIGAAESFEERQPAAERVEEELAGDGCLHDLAGIPDRLMVEAALADHLDDLEKEGIPFALLVVGPRARGNPEAARGVQAAEKMLWVAARTLARSLRSTDFLGRLDNGRLAAILGHCPAAAVPAIAKRLAARAGRTSIQWWGDVVEVEVSIGAAAARAGDSPESLLARAEDALKAGLSVGGERVVVF